jgi:hypothetical protein
VLDTLSRYVRAGGTVVVNAKQFDARQLPAGAEALTGLRLTTRRASASQSVWLPDGSTTGESRYDYTVATPASASVLARTPAGDPVVTRNGVGSGQVYVTTPDYLEGADGGHVLAVGRKLLDLLHKQTARVSVTGPPVQYLVNTSGPRTVVTVVNTDVNGSTWNGTLAFAVPDGRYTVREWTGDTVQESSVGNGQVVVNATVAPYDVRVFALEAGG